MDSLRTPSMPCKKNIRVEINKISIARGGSRTAATSKMERFVIIVNGFQPLTIITKRSIFDVAAVLDPPLYVTCDENDSN